MTPDGDGTLTRAKRSFPFSYDMPVWLTTDAPAVSELLAPDDALVFIGDPSYAWKAPMCTLVNSDGIYSVGDLFNADTIVGTLDGVTGPMTTLWTMAARPRMYQADWFDQKRRAKIRAQLRSNPSYLYRPRTNSFNCMYSVDGIHEYEERAWIRKWGAAYASKLEEIHAFQVLRQSMDENPERKVFVVIRPHRRINGLGVLPVTWDMLKSLCRNNHRDIRWAAMLVTILNKKYL